MSSSKRRFGVALPSELADELDSIVKAFNVDRSAIVEQAVRGFLSELVHYKKPHRCVGVLLLFNREYEETPQLNFVDEYKDVILSYTHHHVGAQCIEVLIVFGDSEVIAGLHMKALKSKCDCRYIPLGHS